MSNYDDPAHHLHKTCKAGVLLEQIAKTQMAIYVSNTNANFAESNCTIPCLVVVSSIMSNTLSELSKEGTIDFKFL